MTTDSLEDVADLVHTTTGIRFDPAHLGSLRSAVSRAVPGMDPAGFLRHMDGRPDGDAVLQRLVDEVTIKETSFLRDRRQLSTIPWRHLLDSAHARGDSHIRIWSAACATGEEAYTLALLASEAFGTATPPVRILGTDVSEPALQAARGGRYRKRAVRRLDDVRRERFLRRVDGTCWDVAPGLRALVRFGQHNLVHDPFPPLGHAGFDLVLCRNVLIYFDDDTVERVVGDLNRSLLPRGQVMLGAADALGTVSRRMATLNDEVSRMAEAGRTQQAAAVMLRRPWGQDGATTAHVRPTAATDPVCAHEAHFVEGLHQLEHANPLAAMRSLRRALHLEPAFALAAFELGRAADALADRGSARSAYEQALRALEREQPAFSMLRGSIDVDDLATVCRDRLATLQ